MWQKSEAIEIAKFSYAIFAGWAALMSGGFSVIFTAWSAFSPASHSQRYFFAILAYCSLWLMVGIIAYKNYKQLENKAKLEAQLTSNLNEIRDLTAAVASESAKHRELSEKYSDLDAKLEALLERKLNIEFDFANTAPSKCHSCNILIFNQSHAQNADDLNVQLVSLNDEMPTEYPQIMKEELHPKLPLRLNLFQPPASQSILGRAWLILHLMSRWGLRFPERCASLWLISIPLPRQTRFPVQRGG